MGINGLHNILDCIQCKKIFLVVDSSFPFLHIKDLIQSLNIDKIVFSDFTPNPIFEQVSKGVDLFIDEECDSILAIGGGSTIDVAKCIKLAVLSTEKKNALIPPLVSQRLPIDENLIPIIAIPTTAGTGSESTHNAVMYYKGAKQTVTNDTILPNYAILEPSVLITLPLYQKKCTMMDALCQAIESWWSVNSTDESKIYSRTAIELIISNWESYIFDNDELAAKQIMLAANYSGRAINISQTTAAHAMSYKITSLYGLPHGHAVAICLPEIWKYMINNINKCIDIRSQEYLDMIFKDIAQAMGKATPSEAIDYFSYMMHRMELYHPKSNNKHADLEELSKSVNPVRLKNNPVYLEVDSIKQIYVKLL